MYIVWKVKDGTVKAQTKCLCRLYFRVTISIWCIFYNSSTHNISLNINLLIKAILLWCSHCLHWKVRDGFQHTFRDIRMKYGFWKAFVTSESVVITENLLLWLSLHSMNIVNVVFNCFTHFNMRRSPHINPLLVSWELALWQRWRMSVCHFNVDTIFEQIFVNNKYFLIFWV